MLPLLYLHGLSSSDFVPALEELFGFAQRDLSEVDYVDCFADGVHFSIRLGEQGRLCCLVIVGVRADGRKELVAVADGTRESTDDWAELLRDLRCRGMPAPVVMWVTGRLGGGGRCGRSFLPPANSDAGCTWSGMSLGRCQERPRRRPPGLERDRHG